MLESIQHDLSKCSYVISWNFKIRFCEQQIWIAVGNVDDDFMSNTANDFTAKNR